MDLESFLRVRLANRFHKSYLEIFPAAPESEDKAILIHYKCYRANEGAKVHALAAWQDNPSQRDLSLREAVRYLQLIERYVK